jgi:hypothetical protein
MKDHTPDLNEEELHAAAALMRETGGGFATRLAALFYVADSHNRARLLYAFGDMFDKFYSVYRREGDKE